MVGFNILHVELGKDWEAFFVELAFSVFEVEEALDAFSGDELEASVVNPKEAVHNAAHVLLSIMPHDFLRDGVDCVLGEGVLYHESINDCVDINVHGEVGGEDDVPVMRVLEHSWELDQAGAELELSFAFSSRALPLVEEHSRPWQLLVQHRVVVAEEDPLSARLVHWPHKLPQNLYLLRSLDLDQPEVVQFIGAVHFVVRLSSCSSDVSSLFWEELLEGLRVTDGCFASQES